MDACERTTFLNYIKALSLPLFPSTSLSLSLTSTPHINTPAYLCTIHLQHTFAYYLVYYLCILPLYINFTFALYFCLTPLHRTFASYDETGDDACPFIYLQVPLRSRLAGTRRWSNTSRTVLIHLAYDLCYSIIIASLKLLYSAISVSCFQILDEDSKMPRGLQASPTPLKARPLSLR